MQEFLSRGPIVLLLLATIGLGIRVKFLTDQLDEAKNEVATLHKSLNSEKQADQTLKDKLQSAEQELQKAHDFYHQTQQNEQQGLEDLAHQYSSEYAKLIQLKQKMDDAKSQQKKNDLETPQEHLKNNQESLRDLEHQLKELNTGKTEVSAEENKAIQRKNQESKVARAEIDAQIKEAQAAVKETQNQISYWQKHPRDINQTAKLKSYESTLADQRQALQNLLAQKQDISETANKNTDYIKNSASAEKENLKDSEGQLREQIARIREENKNLEGQIKTGQRDNSAADSKFRQAESLYQQQFVKVQNLQAAYQKQKQLLDQASKAPVQK